MADETITRQVSERSCQDLRRFVPELGNAYRRGVPQAMSARVAQLLKTPPFERLLLLSETPLSLAVTDERLISIPPGGGAVRLDGRLRHLQRSVRGGGRRRSPYLPARHATGDLG